MQLSAVNSKTDLKNCFKRNMTGWKFYLTKKLPSALCILAFLSLTFSTFGQAIGDYRSASTGNWKELLTWERWNGIAWVTPNPIFPTVAGSTTSAKTDPMGTAHSVSLPSGIVSGDLLLIFWSDANDIATAPTTPSGWTQLYSDPSGNRNRIAWFKNADGTEGTTLNITAGAERSAHNSYRISAGSYFGDPVAGTPFPGTDNTPNPPNLSPGFIFTDNTLWIAASHSTGDDNAPTPSAPGNYTDLISGYTGSGDDHARMLTARRDLSSGSQNPGNFTLGSNVEHTANTIAINGVVIPAGEGVPTSASGAITILSGDTVTVSLSTSADQCTIEAGGQITINSGETFSINNGTGTDITVNGTLSNAGTLSISGDKAFGSSGTYIHDQNDGRVPIATWDANSTCLITGVTNNNPNNTTQNFGHFTWNCPSQTSSVPLSGNAALVIQGNLNVVSTGSGELRFNNDNANIVGGNFTQSGGTLVNQNNNAHSLTVNGNFDLSGGTYLDNGNGDGVLNVAGNFSHTGGTIEVEMGNILNIVFNGGSQTFTKSVAGTISGTVHMTINSGSNLNIGTSQMICEDFTLSAGGTIQTTVNGLASLGQVAPSGDATTDGTITANFVGFVPTMGDMIDVITGASSYTGTPTIITTSNTHQIAATYATGTLSIGVVILPVELTSFQAKAIDEFVELTWSTATEINNEKFIIEHSANGRDYKSIGERQGNGTTLEQQDYSFMDKNPTPGINYYRLKQIDFDGRFEYTKVISVELGRENGSMTIFPNPAGETVTLNFESDYIGGNAQLSLYDHLGRPVLRQSLVMTDGGGNSRLDLSRFPLGLYIVEITIGSKKWQQKLMKK